MEKYINNPQKNPVILITVSFNNVVNRTTL